MRVLIKLCLISLIFLFAHTIVLAAEEKLYEDYSNMSSIPNGWTNGVELQNGILHIYNYEGIKTEAYTKTLPSVSGIVRIDIGVKLPEAISRREMRIYSIDGKIIANVLIDSNYGKNRVLLRSQNGSSFIDSPIVNPKGYVFSDDFVDIHIEIDLSNNNYTAWAGKEKPPAFTKVSMMNIADSINRIDFAVSKDQTVDSGFFIQYLRVSQNEVAEKPDSSNIKKPIEITDTQNHWAQLVMEDLYGRGIIDLTVEGKVEPDKTIQIDEFIKMLMRSMGLKISDDDKDYWAMPYINKAKEVGIIKDNEFNDYTRPILRKEMATLLARSLHEKYVPDVLSYGSKFSDLESAAEYKEDLLKVFTKGIICGFSDSTIRPNATSTRAEASTMIVRRIDAKERIDANCAPMKTFFVSTDGNDANDGSLAMPFKTIEQAQRKVREINADMTGDIIVYIRGGTYNLDYTVQKEELQASDYQEVTETVNKPVSNLIFDERDSGSNGFKVRYKAYEKEKPVLSGGQEVTSKWELFDKTKNIYRAKLSQDIETRQLFVNGNRAVRARSSYFWLDKLIQNRTNFSQDDPAYTVMPDNPTYINALSLLQFSNKTDIEMVFNGLYSSSRIAVHDIKKDGEAVNIYLNEPAYQINALKQGSGTAIRNPWWLENAYEFLDEPGEWYLDRKTKELFYIPKNGEDMTTAYVVIPVINEMLNIKPSDNEKMVHDISFEGIQFSYTTWNRPSTKVGFAETQAGYLLVKDRRQYMKDSAINLTRASNIKFERCAFTHLGVSGVALHEGCKDNLIIGNTFFDISGSGVSMGDPTFKDIDNVFKTDPTTALDNNDIISNYFSNIAIDYFGDVAISGAYLKNTDVMFNEIYNSIYSAMHFNYGWAEHDSSAMSNLRVCNNYIDSVLELMADGAGVYCIGGTGGTYEHPNIIRGNIIKNVFHGHGSHKDTTDKAYLDRNFIIRTTEYAIYLDEGSNNYLVKNNIIENANGCFTLNTGGGMGSARNVNGYDNFYTWSFEGVSKNIVNRGQLNNGMRQAWMAPFNWFSPYKMDSQVKQIVDKAGLLPSYKDISRKEENPERINIEDKEIIMLSGQSLKLPISVTTDRWTNMDISKCDMEITLADPSVVSVDKLGNLKALKYGSTDVYIAIDSNGKRMQQSAKIYVDDSIKDILTQDNIIITMGSARKIYLRFTTNLGRIVPVSEIKYSVKDSNILQIDSEGTLISKALGKTTLVISAKAFGQEIEKMINVEIVSPTGIDISKDVEAWNVDGGGSKELTGNSLSIKTPGRTPGGYAAYTRKTFGNEEFEFNLQINDNQGGWPTIFLRNQNKDVGPLSPSSSAYLLTFDSEEVQIQRFNKGVSTWILGAKGGKESIRNDFFEYGKTYFIQLSVKNENDGVRFVMLVDGRKVLDYLDNTSEAIKENGNIGIIARSGTFIFSNFYAK